MSSIDVIGLGALNIDHLYRVERILEDGEAVISGATSSPGGSAANTIYGLAKLGVNTGFIGVTGDDAAGQLLRDDFQEVGVDISRVRAKLKATTGAVFCLVDRRGQRSLYVMPGANSRLTMDDLNMDYLRHARIIHVSSFADDRQFQLLLDLLDGLTPAVQLSFAPGNLYAARGLADLAPILARTQVLFINQQEIKRLTGASYEAGAEICLQQGCRIVAVTLGSGASYNNTHAASYIRETNNEYIVPAGSRGAVTALDTTGAGDAFATGFLYGLLQGKEPGECSRLGNTVAQFAISKIGARHGLPTPSQLAQRYQELYPQ